MSSSRCDGWWMVTLADIHYIHTRLVTATLSPPGPPGQVLVCAGLAELGGASCSTPLHPTCRSRPQPQPQPQQLRYHPTRRGEMRTRKESRLDSARLAADVRAPRWAVGWDWVGLGGTEVEVEIAGPATAASPIQATGYRPQATGRAGSHAERTAKPKPGGV